MATATYLSNPTINITYSSTTTDFSDQCTSFEMMIQNDALETTAFGDTGHRYSAGLSTVEATMELFLSYGTGEVEALLWSYLGKEVTIVASPSGTTESASNPEYTLTNMYLESFTPINATVGEMSKVTVTFKGGNYARDITNP